MKLLRGRKPCAMCACKGASIALTLHPETAQPGDLVDINFSLRGR